MYDPEHLPFFCQKDTVRHCKCICTDVFHRGTSSSSARARSNPIQNCWSGIAKNSQSDLTIQQLPGRWYKDCVSESYLSIFLLSISFYSEITYTDFDVVYTYQ